MRYLVRMTSSAVVEADDEHAAMRQFHDLSDSRGQLSHEIQVDESLLSEDERRVLLTARMHGLLDDDSDDAPAVIVRLTRDGELYIDVNDSEGEEIARLDASHPEATGPLVVQGRVLRVAA